MAGKLAKRFPLQPTFFASALAIAGTQCLLPLAGSHPRFALFFVCAQQFVGDCAWTVYMVNETVLRQSAVPSHVLGRVSATMQFASRGMAPIGALISGFVGAWIGMTNTLWIGAAGNLLSVLWLLPLVL
jgi:predicted MFS family arabinose efflux permease